MLQNRFIFLLAFMSIMSSSFSQLHWVKKENFPGQARHRSNAFSIGEKGYVGGGHINSGEVVTHADWWEYDPASNSWTQIADFGGGPRYYMASFTLKGAGYSGGGENNDDDYMSDYWKYVPSVNTWFPIADLPGVPRRGSTCFVIDDIAYVGMGQSGGPDNGGYELDFYAYDESSDSWYAVADFIGTARSGAVGFSHGEKGYVGTGHMVGSATRDFYEYDPSTDIWTQLADVDTTFREDAAGFALNGKGYILTGNDVAGEFNYEDVWEYDFEDDSWSPMPEFPGAGRRFMVTFVIGNRAYCGGGTDGTNLNDFWMFDPTYNSINEASIAPLEVFPNPATTAINLKVPANNLDQKMTYELFNSSGKLMHSGNLPQHQGQIDCQNFERGTYILRVHQNERKVAAVTIILN